MAHHQVGNVQNQQERQQGAAGDSDSTDYGDPIGLSDLSSASGASDYGPGWDSDDERILSQLADELSGESFGRGATTSAAQRPRTYGATIVSASALDRAQARGGGRTDSGNPMVQIAYERPGVQPGPEASASATAEDVPTRVAMSPPPLDMTSPLPVDFTTANPRKVQAPSSSAFVMPPATAVRPDQRSPLQRFRPAGRALSVTDMVSPAWCELQWAWTLSRHGRKRPTPKMRQGTKVHRKLEAEVTTKVSVTTSTKEDRFGLRTWNVVQGMHSLRNAGLAREVEVWGLIDGQVLNGIIDELTFVCPDRELEEKARQEEMAAQSGMDEYHLEESSAGSSMRVRRLNSMRMRTERVYVGDVKTRAAGARLPAGAGFRPTLLQLMLYRLLLAQMASGAVQIDALAARYGFRADVPFSDAFIANLSSLNSGYHDAPESSADSDSQPSGSQDPLDVLIEHNSPRRLWDYMLAEVREALTGGLADVLKAEYRAREDGTIMGVKTFLYEEPLILAYVREELAWWTGQREPVGVPEDEAFKCHSCEFADECDWRLGKIEEATTQRRDRNRSQV